MVITMLVPFLLSVFAGILFVFVVKFGLAALPRLASALRQVVPSRYHSPQKPADNHIQVLVLGDIGRSPRMQYHAISFAKHGRKVDIVAYKGSREIYLATCGLGPASSRVLIVDSF